MAVKEQNSSMKASATNAMFLSFVAGLCLLVSGSLADAASRNPVPRIALINGEGARAVPAATFSQIEAILSKQSRLAMVERDEIRKILAEHGLALAGLVESNNILHLGRILPAELFVFLELLPKTSPALLRIQVIEGRSSIVLASILMSESAVTTRAGEIMQSVDAAIRKSEIPFRDRRLLTILGIQNEELNHQLDGLAESFMMFLAADLNQIPQIVLLDREQMEHLRHETSVFGMESLFQGPGVLLEGSIKRVSGQDSVALTLLFHTLGNGDRPLTITLVPDAIAETRRALLKLVLTNLDIAAPGSPLPQDAVIEAVLLYERGMNLLNQGEYQAAARAAEAALALRSRKKYWLLAANAWHGLSDSLYYSTQKIHNNKLLRPGDPGFEDMPTPLKRRILHAALRAMDLYRMEIENHIARWKRHENPEISLPIWSNTMKARWVRAQSYEPEISQLLGELEQARASLAEIERDYYARRWDDSPKGKIGHPARGEWVWSFMLHGGVWTGDYRDWMKRRRAMFDQFEHPPGELQHESLQRMFWSRFTQLFVTLDFMEALDSAEPALQKEVKDFMTEMRDKANRHLLELDQRKSELKAAASTHQGDLETGDTNEIVSLSRFEEAYKIQPVQVRRAEKDLGSAVCSTVFSNEIILAWEQDSGPNSSKGNDYQVTVTKVSLADGSETILGKLTLRRVVQPPTLTSVICEGDSIYVGTVDGLVIFRQGRSKVFDSKNGLPTVSVYSIAALDKLIYLAVASGTHSYAGAGLIAFDPQTERFYTIASSRALRPVHPLDGGLPYSMETLLADVERHCLWLSVSENSNRRGTWRYFPATNGFAKVTCDWIKDWDLRYLSWQNGRIVGCSWSLVAFDPETQEPTFLLSKGATPKAPVLFGNFRGQTTPPPGVWLGDYLIAGHGSPELYSLEKKRPVRLKMLGDPVREGNIRSYHQVGSKFILVASSGRIWTVERRTDK